MNDVESLDATDIDKMKLLVGEKNRIQCFLKDINTGKIQYTHVYYIIIFQRNKSLDLKKHCNIISETYSFTRSSNETQ